MLMADKIISASNQVRQLLSGSSDSDLTALLPHSTLISYSFDQLDELIKFISSNKSKKINLVFWSSRDSKSNNKMWCPDCEDMETTLHNVLTHILIEGIDLKEQPTLKKMEEANKSYLIIVYVGDRTQWKSDDNPFRKPPWNLTKIPTVLKFNPPSKTKNNDEKNSDPKGEEEKIRDPVGEEDDLLNSITFQNEKLVEAETLDFKKLLYFLA